MRARTEQIAARVKPAERKELQDFAAILDVTESDLLRQALEEKMKELRNDPRIRTAIARMAPIEISTVVYE